MMMIDQKPFSIGIKNMFMMVIEMIVVIVMIVMIAMIVTIVIVTMIATIVIVMMMLDTSSLYVESNDGSLLKPGPLNRF